MLICRLISYSIHASLRVLLGLVFVEWGKTSFVLQMSFVKYQDVGIVGTYDWELEIILICQSTEVLDIHAQNFYWGSLLLSGWMVVLPLWLLRLNTMWSSMSLTECRSWREKVWNKFVFRFNRLWFFGLEIRGLVLVCYIVALFWKGSYRVLHAQKMILDN